MLLIHHGHRGWRSHQDLHLEPLPSQGNMHLAYTLRAKMAAGTESHRALLLFRQTLSCVSYPAVMNSES